MKRIFLLSLLIGIAYTLSAQTPSFTASLSSDTTNLEAGFEVTFTIKDGKGQDFQKPDFADFEVLYQNQSTQMNIVNGEIKQSVSYTFGLSAKKEGSFVIEKASVKIEDMMYYTEFLKIVVDESFIPKVKSQKENNFWNPFGDFPEQDSQKPREKPKTKRKVYKI